jgi:hypothetical protein
MLNRGKGTRDMGYGERISDVASLNIAAAKLHDMCFQSLIVRKKLGRSET